FTGDRFAHVFETANGREVATLAGGAILTASFGPVGDVAVTGGRDDVARLWNGRTGTLLHTLRRHAGDVAEAAFSADGARLVTGSTDSTAWVWSVESGEPLADL